MELPRKQAAISVRYQSCQPLGQSQFSILEMAAKDGSRRVFHLPIDNKSLPLVKQVLKSPRLDKKRLAKMSLRIFGCQVYRITTVRIRREKHDYSPRAFFGLVVALPVSKRRRQQGKILKRRVTALDALVVGYLAKAEIIVDGSLTQLQMPSSGSNALPLSGFSPGTRSVLTIQFPARSAVRRRSLVQYPPLQHRLSILSISRQLEEAIRLEQFCRAASLRDHREWLWREFSFESLN